MVGDRRGEGNWRHRNGPLPKVYSSGNTVTRDDGNLVNVSSVDWEASGLQGPAIHHHELPLRAGHVPFCLMLDLRVPTGSLVDQSEMTLVKSSSMLRWSRVEGQLQAKVTVYS